MFKISFCTVAMNRLQHIKETFIKNILDNISYPSVEFNLLDYNSTDGLDSWAQKELGSFIEKNIVHYYKTKEPRYFHRSHSRNMIFKLSSGDILCNVDADNFCGEGFAAYLNQEMSKNNHYQTGFLVPNRTLLEESDRNSYGRIAVKKEDFYLLHGFDEQMDGYGFEDTDFIKRLQKAGKDAIHITEAKFLKGISHSQAMRISEEKYYKTTSKIFIARINPYLSHVVFLFENNKFHYATLVDHELIASLRFQFPELASESLSYAYPVEFLHNKRYTGVWQENNNAISLIFDFSLKHLVLQYSLANGTYEDTTNSEVFFVVQNDYLKESLIYLFPQIHNRNCMTRNLICSTNVNKGGFGKGVVYCNFKKELIRVA